RHLAEDLFSQVSPNPAVGMHPSRQTLDSRPRRENTEAIMKRRLRRGMLAALIAGVTFFYPLLAPTRHRIDEAHFRQIQPGMTRAQVEAIFGAPPGVYDCAEVEPYARWHFFSLSWSSITSIGDSRNWTSRNGCFYVHFDQDDLVASTNHYSEV